MGFVKLFTKNYISYYIPLVLILQVAIFDNFQVLILCKFSVVLHMEKC